MSDILGLAANNLLSPVVLFFVLGLAAALARSDLAIPEAIAKAMSLYLMLAIGFKGGASVASHGLDLRLMATLVTGAALSASIPLIAFRLLTLTSDLDRTDAAAVAAHYGSISIVTFVAASEAVRAIGLGYEGYLVATAAVMETPAILVALWLVRAHAAAKATPGGLAAGSAIRSVTPDAHVMREVLLNGSVVLLIGAFVIGWITGEKGLVDISSFIVAPFKGVLCLFLLDMGLLAGRGLRESGRLLKGPVLLFGFYMPLIGGVLGGLAGSALGLSTGGTAILATLAASASYIAVPAALRLALPEARPAIYLTLSLGVTFPFNLTIGIPLYVWLAGLMS